MYFVSPNFLPVDVHVNPTKVNQFFAIDVMEQRLVVLESEYNPAHYEVLCELTEMEKSLIGIKADVTVENVDDFIVCEECGTDFVYMCKKHPFLLAEDNMVSLPNYEEVEPTPEIAAQLGSTVAELTCPDYCVIKESKILNAGLGVFANIGLPAGICFGPYKGEISENKKMANKSGYAWEIRPRPGEQTRFIDGADPNKSNWLRYINGASVGESQNLHAFQYRGQVFYEVFRPIEKGEELLGKFLFFIFST